jgi:trk system potassium uptake protein TrkA
MDIAARLGNGDASLINVELPYQMRGRRVSEMNVLGEVHVVAITRQGRTFLPTPKTEFIEHDLVHLTVQQAAMDKLKEMFGY